MCGAAMLLMGPSQLQAQEASHRPWLEKADATWSNKATIWQASIAEDEQALASFSCARDQAMPAAQHASNSGTPGMQAGSPCTQPHAEQYQHASRQHSKAPRHKKRSSAVRFREDMDDDILRVASDDFQGDADGAAPNRCGADEHAHSAVAAMEYAVTSQSPHARFAAGPPSLLTGGAETGNASPAGTAEPGADEAADDAINTAGPSPRQATISACGHGVYVSRTTTFLGCAAEQMPQLPEKLLRDERGRMLARLHLHQVRACSRCQCRLSASFETRAGQSGVLVSGLTR